MSEGVTFKQLFDLITAGLKELDDRVRSLEIRFARLAVIAIVIPGLLGLLFWLLRGK